MENFIIICVTIICGIATFFLSSKFKKGAVTSSALITLLSGLILPRLFPEIGGTLAAAGACASYAGMIEAKRITSLKEMGIVSLFVGFIFIIASAGYPGVGGRLGTIAAIGCFAWLALRNIFYKVNILK